jgi:hypothetical protein
MRWRPRRGGRERGWGREMKRVGSRREAAAAMAPACEEKRWRRAGAGERCDFFLEKCVGERRTIGM